MPEHACLELRGELPRVHQNVAVGDLSEGIAVKIAVKMGGGIDEHVQLNAVHEGNVVEDCMVGGDDQRVKVAARIVGAVGIGAIDDQGKRLIRPAEIFENGVHGSHLFVEMGILLQNAAKALSMAARSAAA